MPLPYREPVVVIGEKYERLRILRFSHVDKRWRRHYVVECECGVIKTVQGSLIRSKNTKSCGCLAVERGKEHRLPDDRGIITQIRLGYMRHARSRGLDFNLTHDEFAAVIRQPCYYCGEVAGNFRRSKNRREGFPHNGIDRLDSRYGYRSDNVVAACPICNNAKRDMSLADFKQWAIRLGAMAAQWSTLSRKGLPHVS